MPTVNELKEICRNAGIKCSGSKSELLARVDAAKRNGTIFPSIKHAVCPSIRANMKKADALRRKEKEAKRVASQKIHQLDALIADAQKQRNEWYKEYKRAEIASDAAFRESNRLLESCKASCESATEPCLLFP